MSAKPKLYLFYLSANFNMHAFTSAIEILRLANYVLGRAAYEWRVVSNCGSTVVSSCGINVSCDSSVAEAHLALSTSRPSMVLLCSNQETQTPVDSQISLWLSDCLRRNVSITSLCSGTYTLAQAGLLDGRRCTVHWEMGPLLAEKFAKIEVSSDLFEVNGVVNSCAGGTASLDMMLHLMQAEHGDLVASKICAMALVHKVRSPSDRQRKPLSLIHSIRNPVVLKVVDHMERNIAIPVKTGSLNQLIGMSRRQMERLFNAEVGCAPTRFYLRLRIERARYLVAQTSMQMTEIAAACGFVSSSHFSKCFRNTFGCTPIDARLTGAALVDALAQ